MVVNGVSEEYDVVLDCVSKRFGNVVAMEKVSLRLKRGTFLTLLGPSGCGKTTTLRVIGGFEKPSGGKVFIKGRDVEGVPPYKRETNLVFQDYALFPHMDVLENIGFGLKVRGVSKAEIRRNVERMLEMVGLPDIILRRPNQLSGGQRQRVALCRALILEPAVLLLDEPLGALDAKIRKQMQTELKGLQKKLGLTFIAVTHDQEEAMTMSDVIAIMNQGQIEQMGDPQSIYEKPHSRFVATFLGECNLMDVEISEQSPDGVVAIESRLGELVFKPDPEWERTVEKWMCMVVRPEHIRMGPEAEGFDNRIAGMVRSSIFKGSITEYILESNGVALKVEKQGRGHYTAGDQVLFGWKKEDCYLVR